MPTCSATRARCALVFAAWSLAGCTAGIFSGIPLPDRSRPTVLVETRGGVESGVATVHGVLFLGRTAQEGPCRVRYALGDSITVEDGRIEPWAGVFYEARIDTKTPDVHLLPRDLRPDEELFAIEFPADGRSLPKRVSVRRARGDGLEGNLLDTPRRWQRKEVPVGTPLFVEENGELLVAGLVAGRASWAPDPSRQPRDLVLFAGPDLLREALRVPRVDEPIEVIQRPDGISSLRPWTRPLAPADAERDEQPDSAGAPERGTGN